MRARLLLEPIHGVPAVGSTECLLSFVRALEAEQPAEVESVGKHRVVRVYTWVEGDAGFGEGTRVNDDNCDKQARL